MNHVLAGLPVGFPEGAETVGEKERDRPTDFAAGVGPIDPAAGVGPIGLDPEEVAIPLTLQALRDDVCKGHQPYLANSSSCVCA